MNNSKPEKLNYFDEGMDSFIKKYQYELIASFGLLVLIGGIVLATIIFKDKGKEIVIESDSGMESVVTKQEVQVIVDIRGAVVLPDLYKLPQDSRLSDAITAAGGFSEEADTVWIDKTLNMAEPLFDGQKIYIPSQSEQTNSQEGSAASSDGGVSTKININTASISELISLPGIGQAYAQRIIDNRPYRSVDELKNVSGIGSKKFESIKDLVSVY